LITAEVATVVEAVTATFGPHAIAETVATDLPVFEPVTATFGAHTVTEAIAADFPILDPVCAPIGSVASAFTALFKAFATTFSALFEASAATFTALFEATTSAVAAPFGPVAATAGRVEPWCRGNARRRSRARRSGHAAAAAATTAALPGFTAATPFLTRSARCGIRPWSTGLTAYSSRIATPETGFTILLGADTGRTGRAGAGNGRGCDKSQRHGEG
jgi:hypothetical protein